MAPASPDTRFSYPQPSRGPWWIWLVAVALHLPLLYVQVYRAVDDDGREGLIRIDTRSLRGVRILDMPYPSGEAGPASSTPRPGPSLPRRPVSVRTPISGATSPTPMPPADTGASQVAPPQPFPAPAPSPPAGAGGAPSRRIGPSYATGRLWVRPLPVSPQELAERLREKTHVEKVDSAVGAIIQDYLDRLALEETGRPEPLPSWTTKIAGKTVGVDSKWIYLGPIKVPAFLLGLIPLNVQANPTQAEMNRRLSVMREDLFDAARRSANYADFKAAVTKLREEKQRERDLQKAQRTAPSDQDKP